MTELKSKKNNNIFLLLCLFCILHTPIPLPMLFILLLLLLLQLLLLPPLLLNFTFTIPTVTSATNTIMNITISDTTTQDFNHYTYYKKKLYLLQLWLQSLQLLHPLQPQMQQPQISTTTDKKNYHTIYFYNYKLLLL